MIPEDSGYAAEDLSRFVLEEHACRYELLKINDSEINPGDGFYLLPVIYGIISTDIVALFLSPFFINTEEKE